jgi:Flp pilus assembly protein TadB
MSTDVLLAAAVFGGIGCALALLIVAVRGTEVRRSAPPLGQRLDELVHRVGGRRVVAAAGVGLLIAVVTRWPVAALSGAALVYCWPRLFGGAGAARTAVARLEALATWTESLKDTIAGAVGLEQAIPATVPAASPLIQPQLIRLVGRLRAREPLADALLRFNADLDDPSAELAVGALILNAQLRGPGLKRTLAALAESAREELDVRRRIEAGRLKIRRGVQIVVGVTLGFVAVVASLNGDYLQPYDTPVGQLVLLVVAAFFAGGFLWLRSLSEFATPERLLPRPADALGTTAPSRLTVGSVR